MTIDDRGVIEAEVAQQLLIGAVAPDDRLARLPRRAHVGRIQIHRQVLEALRHEHARQLAADAAEAAQHHVLAPRELPFGGRGTARHVPRGGPRSRSSRRAMRLL